MKYSFSGHESFLCKSLWLKKGYDFIFDNHKFSDSNCVVQLGVGKNMVSSIKYWMRAFYLIDDVQLTDYAKYIFDQHQGKDPFAEDVNTLWILHFLLVTTNVASIYRLIFLDFQREKRDFDKDQILLFIKRKCSVPEQKNVFNENTVKKDIRVFLQNYLSPANPKSLEEYTGLLISLGLIRENDGVYTFCETSRDSIDPLIIYFALIAYSLEDLTISFDKLQELSLLFCIPITEFLLMVRDLSNKYPQEIVYTDNSGIRNVQFLKKLNAFDILNKYYDNHEL